MNLLIVDDDPTNLKLLRAQLESKGHALFEAHDGVEALALLNRQRVDVVISDILMPRMDGYRLCHEIRMNERLHDLPFILCTSSFISPGDEKLALDVGADKYLRKPCSLETLVAALHEVIAKLHVAPRAESMGEVEVLKEYSEQLVNKLEEKNAELMATEAKFRSLQNMEVVGRLAAGFTHDFNNLLTIVNGYAELLLERISQQDAAHPELLVLQDAGKRATILAQRLLSLSRERLPQPSILDLNSIIIGLDHMLGHVIGDEIRLTLRLDPECGHIKADGVQIEQMILNLAINARDAMPDGGELTIETENKRPDDRLTNGQGGATGDYVLLTVTDSGHGMDEATKAQIFEPFFTTKEVGKGTGLGLWMALGIIQQSGGTITVDSEPGRGTSFRISLPGMATEAKAAALTNPAPSVGRGSPGGSESILVVEDNEVLSEFARETLEPAGYRVLLARNGAEAITAAQKEANQIHLLMTDIEMPGVGATNLVDSLADSQPAMKVLYVSGWPYRAAVGEEPAERGVAYLQKPFTPDTLLQRIRQFLDAPPEATIVVVDDDPAIRGFLRHFLRLSGYRVLEAANGRQAVQHLRQRKVDLLITDLLMPDQEGLETIQAVRKEFPDLPVVAMSGGFGGQFLSVAEKLGAREILHKPFGVKVVRELVLRLLATRTNQPK
jgi:hypothetical protein